MQEKKKKNFERVANGVRVLSRAIQFSSVLLKAGLLGVL